MEIGKSIRLNDSGQYKNNNAATRKLATEFCSSRVDGRRKTLLIKDRSRGNNVGNYCPVVLTS